MKPIFYSAVLLLTIVLFSSCQPDDYLQPKLQNTHWQASEFSVVAPSFQDSDSTFTIKANENNWEQVLKGQPSTIELKADGSYIEEHFDVNNSRILSYEGAWTTEGDSLFLDIKKPVKTEFKYMVTIDEAAKILSLSRQFDYDRDSQKDDKQVVSYKKQ